MNGVTENNRVYTARCRLAIATCFSALIVIWTGCGGGSADFAEVRGRVLLDGEPLTTGSVITMPEQGRGARGTINSQGEFSLSTADRGSGASVGTHYVAVVAMEHQDAENFNPEAPVKSLIPQRYANPETSGFEIEVVPGGVRGVVLELSSK